MDFVYASDETFVKVAGISLVSLLKNNSNCIIHFFNAGISENSQQNLKRLVSEYGSNSEIHFYDVNGLLSPLTKNMPALEGSFATYARLFIEVLLPKNIEKCLYIDCDTLISKNLEEIFKQKDDYTLYMSYDLVTNKHKKEIGLTENDEYFNAGLCFINLKRFREKDYTKVIVEHLKTNPSYKFHDQDILNILFNKDIGLLNLKYNAMSQNLFFNSAANCKKVYKMYNCKYYSKKEYKEALKNVYIYHFTCLPFLVRPWINGSNHPVKKQYYNIRDCDNWLSSVMIDKTFSKTQSIIQKILFILPPVIGGKIMTFLFIIFYKIEN